MLVGDVAQGVQFAVGGRQAVGLADEAEPQFGELFFEFLGGETGAEAGVSEALRSAALEVFIPTVGVESLNAAVAAGILLYEARRQRSLRS